MGYLSDDYLKSLSQKPAIQPGSSAASAPAPTTSPAPIAPTQSAPVAPQDNSVIGDNPINIPGISNLTPEQQTARYGGPVGSPEYFKTKAESPMLARLPTELMSTLGIHLPDEQSWDSMSELNKSATVVAATTAGLGRMIRDLPKAVTTSLVRATSPIYDPIIQAAQGKVPTVESLRNAPVRELPWVGAVPNYYQTFDQARKSGMGPLASAVFTGGTAAGDVLAAVPLLDAVSAVFRPRALPFNGVLKNTEPIKTAMTTDEAGVPKPVNAAKDSVSEYYTMPKTTAEGFGGRTNNTFLKMTPAGAGSVEVSVVQTRGGAIPRTVDFVKSKFGVADKVTQGDFGPEVKLTSKVIDAPESFKPTGNVDLSDPLRNIPPKAIKGMEAKPITATQASHLDAISSVNKIPNDMADAISRIVTGKSVIGEMTQADYVKVAQTLARVGDMGKLTQDVPSVGFFKRTFAAPRHWTRSIEEQGGPKVYSEVYVPMEESTRVAKTMFENYNQQLLDIHGKYSSPQYADARRAVVAYGRGDKAAILENPTFDGATKAELVDVAEKMKEFFARVGPELNVPAEIHKQNYFPSIQDLGGVYQRYKGEGGELSKEEFFAKFKKTGSLNVNVDDSLALGQIYAKQGSNVLVRGPVMERIAEFAKTLPPELKKSVESYIGEKRGFAGQLERSMDRLVPSINKKLGLGLPPDAARQMTDLVLSTMYSGLLSSPATWFRQAFQYPLFGYARLGSRFMGEAIMKGTSKEGIEEARKAGFLNALGVPYGEEIAKEGKVAGKLITGYKTGTQAIISPNATVDNSMRAITYHQAKLQFFDSLQRFNTGKITWQKLESELDLSGFSPADRNIIRSRLASGDTQGAFNNYVRDVIDETNFPYRRGSSARVTYGLGGKLGTSLLQWPMEAAGTLGRWVSTGQWEKIIRFAGAATAIQKTMADEFGFDFTKTLGVNMGGVFVPAPTGAFSNLYSPFVKTALDGINGFSAMLQQNDKAFNDNRDSIVKTLGAATPGGVARQQLQSFYKSYNAGPDQNDQYTVYDKSGDAKYRTDFNGLFWGVLMGFPTNEKVADQKLTTDIYNAQEARSQVSSQIVQLWQQEKYDEAAKLMQENPGVVPNLSNATKREFIPFNQGLFNTLPPDLKAEFAPRVFSK